MTDWSALVRALYDATEGGWREVAKACRVNGHESSPNTYRRIALGEIKKPGVAVRRGIVAALKEREIARVTGLHSPWVRSPRWGLTVTYALGERVNQWRNRHGLTWDEWMDRAHDLMRREGER